MYMYTYTYMYLNQNASPGLSLGKEAMLFFFNIVFGIRYSRLPSCSGSTHDYTDLNKEGGVIQPNFFFRSSVVPHAHACRKRTIWPPPPGTSKCVLRRLEDVLICLHSMTLTKKSFHLISSLLIYPRQKFRKTMQDKRPGWEKKEEEKKWIYVITS